MKQSINGVISEMNAEQEAAYLEKDAKFKEWLAVQKAATDKTATDKAAGKQKLKDLGLNDDEIKALTGK